MQEVHKKANYMSDPFLNTPFGAIVSAMVDRDYSDEIRIDAELGTLQSWVTSLSSVMADYSLADNKSRTFSDENDQATVIALVGQLNEFCSFVRADRELLKLEGVKK